MQSFVDHPAEVQESGLGDRQLEELRAGLGDLRDEYQHRFEQSDDLFRTLTADRSVDANEREAARRAAQEAAVAVERTDQALAQIAAGTYGSCESCGQPIPFERLEALPGTQTCVSCPDVH